MITRNHISQYLGYFSISEKVQSRRKKKEEDESNQGIMIAQK